LQDRLSKVIGDKHTDYHKFFTLGFWPGGDRDGNPFVRVRLKKIYLMLSKWLKLTFCFLNLLFKVDTTKKVADLLRKSIIKCYIRDIRKVKRR